jgi:hypothetical protein
MSQVVPVPKAFPVVTQHLNQTFCYPVPMRLWQLRPGYCSGPIFSAHIALLTLNELYYFPGGNTSLKPEQGWSQDAGYSLSFKSGPISLFHDVSVFNRNIHDWILWVGGAIWTPHNISEVHSRGVETENNIIYTIGNLEAFILVSIRLMFWPLLLPVIYTMMAVLGSRYPIHPDTMVRQM